MVYIDEPMNVQSKTWRYKSNCHMLADSLEELHAMADRIGLKREWIQIKKGDPPHYDLTASKRALAIRHGAKSITWEEMVKKVQELRAKGIGTANE